MIHFKIWFEDEPGVRQEMEVQSPTGTYIGRVKNVIQSRLWGRDFYLDVNNDANVTDSWEGKTFQAKWRCRGGMYKEDAWATGPNLLDEEIPLDTTIAETVVCGKEWTKIQVNAMHADEECAEFVRNKYGTKVKAMVRHIELQKAKIQDQDVIIVYRDEAEEIPWVKVHIKWGDKIKNPVVQETTTVGGLMNMIERKFGKSVRRRQIPRPDNHVYVEGETIEIDDEEAIFLETDDLSFKVRISERTEAEIMRRIKNIWWPSPEEEEKIKGNTREGQESGRIKLDNIRLRLGPITRELIGRFPFGIAEWVEGDKGIAAFSMEQLKLIWNVGEMGVRTILGSERFPMREREGKIVAQHNTLIEGMLLEDWEAVKTREITRKKVIVRDDRDRTLFLEMNVSKELIARQISEQLGFTVVEENIRISDYTPWEGCGMEGQKLYITDFWRWTENKKGERFNVSRTNTRRDAIEQLGRLGLDPTEYHTLEATGDGVVLRRERKAIIESEVSDQEEGDMLEVAMREEERDPERPIKEKFPEPRKFSGDPRAKVIVRGTPWLVSEEFADLFEAAELKRGGKKGWLLSERFTGTEDQEIVTEGPLRVEGIWWSLEMRNWLETQRYMTDAFIMKIGNRKIIYEGPLPDSKGEAEDTFWEETGLRPEEWKIVWRHGNALTGKLMKRPKREQTTGRIVQLSATLPTEKSITPRQLPQEIRTPASGSLKTFFQKKIGYHLGKVKIWKDGQFLDTSLVPRNKDVYVQYLPRERAPDRAMAISWPDRLEIWLISKPEMRSQMWMIAENRGFAKIDGDFYSGAEIRKDAWPADSAVKWVAKERPRAYQSATQGGGRGKTSAKGIPVVSPCPTDERITVRDTRIKCGEDPCLSLSESEARRWLEENERWRNDKAWDGKKNKPGDHFKFKNGVREEKDVRYISPDGLKVLLKANQARYLVESGGDWNINPVNSRWGTHEKIPREKYTWSEEDHPRIICEDDPEVNSIPCLAGKVREWMEDAKRNAIGKSWRTAMKFHRKAIMR
jgi:hypothetical protein